MIFPLTTCRSSSTILTVSTHQKWKRVCIFVCRITIVEGNSGSRSSSLLFTQRFNSMLYTNFTTVDKSSTKTSVNSTSGIIMFLFLSTRGILGIQSDSENLRFQGFFIFIVPISTSSRSASISSMLSPIRARSVVRGFVGLTSALLCHTRFLAAENCSQ